jgi:hypothetical protein
VRTKEEQQIEFNKNGLTVKNAKPGTSPHESANGGLAIDVNLILFMGGSKYSYTKHITKADNTSVWIDTGVPSLAKELGLLWGGDAFNGYYDPVHFQIVPQSTATTKKQLYKTVKETVKSSYLDESAIFSNFKVNQHVFDFFMRREQFAKKYHPENVNRKIYKKEVKAALG